MAPDSAPADDAAARAPLSISALVRAVAGALEREFALLWVRGEVCNLTRAASGHWYFTLKDDQAQVRCVMFRGRNVLVSWTLRDGDAIEARVQPGLYAARGEFQLNVETMRRAGQGQLFEQFLQLKARLAAEGLFDAAARRPLPALPRRIGIVTSLQAAALRDVLTTLARRAPYAGLIVYPVPVQGAGAGATIAAMLDVAGRRAEVDALLLVRGGGSLEDLWAFNEEAVARAIRRCALPVVVGVGHESDSTIADFAADLRAPTPTAAAELVAPDRAQLLGRIDVALATVQRLARRALAGDAQRLDYAVRALAVPRAPLVALEARVHRLQQRAGAVVLRRFESSRRALTRLQADLRAAGPRTAPAPIQLASGRLTAAARATLAARTARVMAVAGRLDALDPHRVLQRGYALALDAQGRAVTDAATLAVGAALRLQFARGAADVRVEQAAADDAAVPPSTRVAQAPG